MISTYVKEFTAVVKHLKKSEKTLKKGDFLIVKKSIVVEMLEKNAYETAKAKLKVWKGLRWLDADDRRLTKRVTDEETGKQVPILRISLKAYDTLQMINEKIGKTSVLK